MVLAAFGAALGLVGSADAGESGVPPKWPGQITVEVKPGSDRDIGRLDILFPFLQGSDHLLFADVRLVDPSGSSVEGNLGLGYRQLHRGSTFFHGDGVWGLYGFYERRKSDREQYYHQGTVGGELFTEWWSLRANGYFPERGGNVIGRRSSATAGTGIGLNGTTVVVTPFTTTTTLTARERALPGFDVEAGLGFEVGKGHELWFYGGFFRFDTDETPSVSGTRIRAEFRLRDLMGWPGSELSLGGEVQNDGVRGTEGFGVVRLRIPFGHGAGERSRALTTIERRMTEFVHRDVDVVTFAQNLNAPPGAKDAPEVSVVTQADAAGQKTLTDQTSGDPLNVFFVDQAGGGNCTQGSPCTVAAAQMDPQFGAGDTLVLLDNSGTIVSSVALNAARQQVRGGGDTGATTLTLPTGAGDQLSLSGLGARPTLRGTVDLADDSSIGGFTLDGGGAVANGIQAANVTAATIEGMEIRNFTTRAIDLDMAAGAIVITDVDLASNPAGIELRNFTGDLTLSRFDVAGNNAVVINGGNKVTISDGSITGVGTGNGIRTRSVSELTVDTVTITNVANLAANSAILISAQFNPSIKATVKNNTLQVTGAGDSLRVDTTVASTTACLDAVGNNPLSGSFELVASGAMSTINVEQSEAQLSALNSNVVVNRNPMQDINFGGCP